MNELISSSSAESVTSMAGPLGGTLLAWEIRAALVIATVAAIHFSLRRWIPPRFVHALWLIALARLLLPLVPPAPSSVQNLFPRAAAAPPTFRILIIEPPERTRGEPVAPQDPSRSVGRQPEVAVHENAPLPRIMDPRTLVSIAALALGLGWFLHRERSARRALRQWRATDAPRLLRLLRECGERVGLGGTVELCVVPGLSTPAVAGWWRPAILLPKAIADRFHDDELRLVLLHELIHVRRRDPLTAWLADLAVALHWWNPLAWVVRRALDRWRERSVDAGVLSLVGVEARVRYGRTLLKAWELGGGRAAAGVSSWSTGAGALAMFARGDDLKGRIAMIVKTRDGRGGFRVLFGVVAVAGSLACGLTDAQSPASPAPGVQSERLAGVLTETTRPPNLQPLPNGPGTPPKPLAEPRTEPRPAIASTKVDPAVVPAGRVTPSIDAVKLSDKPQFVVDLMLITSRDMKPVIERWKTRSPAPDGPVRSLSDSELFLIEELIRAQGIGATLAAPRVTLVADQSGTVETSIPEDDAGGPPMLSKLPYLNRLYKNPGSFPPAGSTILIEARPALAKDGAPVSTKVKATVTTKLGEQAGEAVKRVLEMEFTMTGQAALAELPQDARLGWLALLVRVRPAAEVAAENVGSGLPSTGTLAPINAVPPAPAQAGAVDAAPSVAPPAGPSPGTR
jgi:beta-lactamase regulating signal transducer with metallopeptidase domain